MATAAVTAGALLALAACGSDEGSGETEDGSVELSVSLFGTFGYDEAGLFDQYEEENPGVTISYESTQGEDTYWPALLTRLNAGSGAADIQGIEVARIRDVATTELADRWVDLTETAAADQLAEYAQWKQDAATTDDGAVIGLGTDIGPTGICYRTDLLEQAGLPTDPDELADADGVVGGLPRARRAVQGLGPGGQRLDRLGGRPLQRHHLDRGGDLLRRGGRARRTPPTRRYATRSTSPRPRRPVT